ncbi:hypothetical protein Ddc_11677 [Ditylenchus destructor]|nr:hypothetical protein Ddc_11677 [Ditylenchus destructor]
MLNYLSSNDAFLSEMAKEIVKLKFFQLYAHGDHSIATSHIWKGWLDTQYKLTMEQLPVQWHKKFATIQETQTLREKADALWVKVKAAIRDKGAKVYLECLAVSWKTLKPQIQKAEEPLLKAILNELFPPAEAAAKLEAVMIGVIPEEETRGAIEMGPVS